MIGRLLHVVPVALLSLTSVAGGLWYDITPESASPTASATAATLLPVDSCFYFAWQDEPSELEARYRSIWWSDATILKTFPPTGFLLLYR